MRGIVQLLNDFSNLLAAQLIDATGLQEPTGFTKASLHPFSENRDHDALAQDDQFQILIAQLDPHVDQEHVQCRSFEERGKALPSQDLGVDEIFASQEAFQHAVVTDLAGDQDQGSDGSVHQPLDLTCEGDIALEAVEIMEAPHMLNHRLGRLVGESREKLGEGPLRQLLPVELYDLLPQGVV